MYDDESRRRLQSQVNAAIAAKAERFAQPMTLVERAQLFLLMCRTAESMEANRRRMGLPPSEVPQWTESTWDLLRELSRHQPVNVTKRTLPSQETL
jgi:hypothetical protein